MRNNQTEIFYEFEFVGRQDKGWMGFSLSTNKSTEDSTSVVGYYPNKILLFNNHTEQFLDNFSEMKVIRPWNFVVDGIFSFKITLNASVMSGKKYLSIGQYSDHLYEWTNKTVLPKHSALSDFINFDLNSPNENYPFCTTNLNFPGRLMAFNWISYTISALLLALIGFIFIYYRNEQPLKSRFVAPLYCIIGTHTGLIGEFIYGLFPFEQSAYFQCAFHGFFVYAPVQFSLVIPSLMIIRYTIFLQLHFYKRNYIKKHRKLRKTMFGGSTSGSNSFISNENITMKKENTLMKLWKMMRDFLSRLKSPWFFVVLPFIWTAFYMFCAALIFGIGGFRCSTFSRTYIRIAHIILLGVAFILLTTFIFLDFLLSIRRWIKCEWKIYLYEEDPFHYRLDMLTCIVAFYPMLIIWAVVPLPKMISGAIVDYLNIIAVVLTGGTALVITIFQTVKHSIQSKINEKNEAQNPNRIHLTPEMIFAEKTLLDIFLKFATLEWSSENIYFVLDVMEYKKLKDLKAKRHNAFQIKENYFIPNVSPLQVNVTGKNLKPCLKMMDENDFTNELFDAVQEEVEVNICDTISRFIISDEYKEYKKYDAERLITLGL
eukprot:gene6851-11012_t